MKPLQGKKILVTREASQAKAFSRQIALAGGIPVELPLLEINCSQRAENLPIWQRLDSYSWILFTSANGVDCFFRQLEALKIPANRFASAKIGVVGHKTENALKEHGKHADFIPSVYDAETMGHEFLRKHPRPGTILLVRGSRSRDVLPHLFGRENIAFDSLEVYETVYNKSIGSKLTETLDENEFAFITFTSPSTIEAFIDLGGLPHLLDTSICCIGTTTAEKAESCGFADIIVPDEFTIEGMVSVMGHAVTGKD
ncbi:uroporphyrinogen-III synthase [Aciduricibacillus chroicocephali]|uniref:Uroporphyrinogen-III synthase n=1 Tax=Aciduricibacillus chroicocephali TaxID=3054939 RepID=A0ABY9KS95_9BACI|nr:uroporphyrinogen-III synthase [Bacillaceae bacterium 44XB]